jgi:hypothetical protein
VPAAVLLLSVTAPAQTTITNGLVAYWAFDDNLLDSKSAFHGTARGTAPIAFVDGKAGFGKAIQLNGLNQFVEITGGSEDDLEFPGGSMSIGGWFRVDAFDTDWQALVAKGEGSNYRVARRAAGNSIAYAGGVGEGADDAPEVNDGQWHHFVAVSDATGTNVFGTAIYIDGNIYGINETLPVLASNSMHLMIGENPEARNREWEGLIDDMALWNRVLTASEVTNLYAAGVGTPISTMLPKPATEIVVSSLITKLNSFVFVATSKGTSIVDPATAVLTIDSQPAAVTFTTNGLDTTFTHIPAVAWLPERNTPTPLR